MLTIPSRVIAACFALVGFAAAVVVGAVAGNPVTTVLLRALVVMGVCWLIGRVVGFITSRTVTEHIETYKQQHPLPDDSQSTGEVDLEAEPAPESAQARDEHAQREVAPAVTQT